LAAAAGAAGAVVAAGAAGFPASAGFESAGLLAAGWLAGWHAPSKSPTTRSNGTARRFMVILLDLGLSLWTR
jgi:hypothetical protein